jgi:hypothetical protein
VLGGEAGEGLATEVGEPADRALGSGGPVLTGWVARFRSRSPGAVAYRSPYVGGRSPCGQAW